MVSFKSIISAVLAFFMSIVPSGCSREKTVAEPTPTPYVEVTEAPSLQEPNDYSFAESTGISAEEALAKIPFGISNNCKMDKNMAEAYLSVLKSLPQKDESEPEFVLSATLLDPAGDGMPILITGYIKYANELGDGQSVCCGTKNYTYKNMELWGYKNGKAERANIPDLDFKNGFGSINEGAYFRTFQYYPDDDPGNKRTSSYYKIENGTITLAHSVEVYTAFVAVDGMVTGVFPEGVTYGKTRSELENNGWGAVQIPGGSVLETLILDNGKNVTAETLPEQYDTKVDHDLVVGYVQTWGDLCHRSDNFHHIAIECDKAESVTENLKQFINALSRPSYRYANIAKELTKGKFNKLFDTVNNVYGGKIGEIYSIIDDVYYVIVYSDGAPCGGILVRDMQNNGDWRIVKSGETLLSEAELDRLAVEDKENVKAVENTPTPTPQNETKPEKHTGRGIAIICVTVVIAGCAVAIILLLRKKKK